jgi:hypothetical protein
MKLALKTLFPAVAATALLATSAHAEQTIKVPAFRAIELHGGGEAILRHGDTQRVILIKGDPNIVRIEVHGDGVLDLSPCKLTVGCPWRTDLKVEVITPAIAAIEVHGGGEMSVKGQFPQQPSLKLSVHGGGEADLRAIPADHVIASVHGGGDADVHAIKTLKASVHGGGDLHYWGHPSVESDVHGGGSLDSEE